MTFRKYSPHRHPPYKALPAARGNACRVYWSTSLNGGDLVSTWVAKPEVHAEDAGFLVNPSAKYSCQRRQLRTRRLIPGRVPSDWSRACASSHQASSLTSSSQSSPGVARLKLYRDRRSSSLPVGSRPVKQIGEDKHVDPGAEGSRTRVRFPPPPPDFINEYN